jgi:hypothetical protein
MAQTGFTPLQLYSTSTAAAAPTAGNLTNSTLGSELAINITDGKLFYKDNANAIQVIGWKVRPANAGGTGITSYAVGDILYADTTSTLAKLADVATGNALISGGVNTAPSYGKIGLTTHVSGVLPVANGGTNASTASITSFNNITGYTAAGATGTTSTNLVFSTSPSITTPTLVDNVTLSTGNLIFGTSGKGATDSTGAVSLNFSSTAITANAPVVAALFRTDSGTVSALNATATTIYTMPTLPNGLYVVQAALANNAPATFTAVSLIRQGNGTSAATALSTATNMTVSVSGLNIQATQSAGGTATISWSVIRFA